MRLFLATIAAAATLFAAPQWAPIYNSPEIDLSYDVDAYKVNQYSKGNVKMAVVMYTYKQGGTKRALIDSLKKIDVKGAENFQYAVDYRYFSPASAQSFKAATIFMDKSFNVLYTKEYKEVWNKNTQEDTTIIMAILKHQMGAQ